MSEIAREARTLAEQQVEDASEISSIAKQAYDISSEAYEMARAAMEQQQHTAQKVQGCTKPWQIACDSSHNLFSVSLNGLPTSCLHNL